MERHRGPIAARRSPRTPANERSKLTCVSGVFARTYFAIM